MSSSILFKEMFAISIYLLRLSPALLYVPTVTAILARRLTPWGQKCRIQKDINKTRNQLTMKEDELWVGCHVRSLNPRIDRRLDLRWVVLQSILYSSHMVPSYQWYFLPLQISSENDFYDLYIKETLSQPSALPFYYENKDSL